MKPFRLSYQNGSIREVHRNGWTAYKLRWRERQGGTWTEQCKTLPRFQDAAQTKPTLLKHASQELKRLLSPVNAVQGRTQFPVVTFNRLLELQWADYVTREKLRRSTQDGYTAMLENWLKPFFGDMLLSQITKATVGEFFTHLRAEGLSDQYQKNIYGLLNKLFELAVAFDLLQFSPVNPMLHRPHVNRGEKQTLPVGKIQAFFEALPVDFRAPIAVLLLTGMRQGELLGLRWEDVDFASKLIHKRNVVYRGELVSGLKETRKASNGRPKQHVIGLSPVIENLLRHHKEHSLFANPECFVFCREDGRPLDPDHIRRYVLYPAMEKAKIPIEARSSGLHLFRHTVVSAVARRLGLKSAQDQAGHADISTTADIYTHVDIEQKIATAQAIQEAFAAQLRPSLPQSLVSC